MEIDQNQETGTTQNVPIPLNSSSSYGDAIVGQQMIHHQPAETASNHHNMIIQIPRNGPTSSLENLDHVPYKKMVRYRECLKNHAATIGGNATDGCGEFLPNGEQGTLQALICSVCNCHRNFHRKEVEGCDNFYPSSNYYDKRLILHPNYPNYPHHQMIMSCNLGGNLGNNLVNIGSDQSDEQENGKNRISHMGFGKKRFRTKFTQEQKEKMQIFAEKLGWKIQKQEESSVQEFCQEIGVKRRVFKVWMHNNKLNLAKKNTNEATNPKNHI